MTTPLAHHRALALLDQCTGDHIWSWDYCQQRGVPEEWFRRLSDTYESGFTHDSQTIYTDHGLTNQYRGLRDVDLAVQIGRFLDIDVDTILSRYPSRLSIVSAIKHAVSDGE